MEYCYQPNNDTYAYRTPGMRHGDGQIDTDDHPVWLACDEADLVEAGIDPATVPVVYEDD